MCHLGFLPVVMAASDDASAQSIPWAESSVSYMWGGEFKLMHLDGYFHPLIPVEAVKLTGLGAKRIRWSSDAVRIVCCCMRRQRVLWPNLGSRLLGRRE
jgi:hypothetical protein